MVARAFHGGGIDAAGRRPALLDEDARPHDAVPPRRRCALRVERGLEDVVGGRTIEAVLEIVLARPDDLHWPTDGLRRLHRVGNEIGLPAPTEAAAEQRGVDGHFLERQARDLGGERLVAAGILRRHPHLDRKSTRLNSSHTVISYAVFCLKKKKVLDRRLLAILAVQPPGPAPPASTD